MLLGVVELANWGVGNQTSGSVYPRGKVGLGNLVMGKSKSTNGRSFPLPALLKFAFTNLYKSVGRVSLGSSPIAAVRRSKRRTLMVSTGTVGFFLAKLCRMALTWVLWERLTSSTNWRRVEGFGKV